MADPRNAGILFLILGLLLAGLGVWILLAGRGNLGYLLLVGGGAPLGDGCLHSPPTLLQLKLNEVRAPNSQSGHGTRRYPLESLPKPVALLQTEKREARGVRSYGNPAVHTELNDDCPMTTSLSPVRS